MVAEVVGGLLSGSLALLADAGHMLTDAAALLVALMAVHFSQRKPNARHTFGYLRLTTGGLPQRRSAAGDRGIHPVGGNTAFLRTAAGDGYPDVDHRRSGAAGEPVRLLAAPPRQRRENINVRAAALHVLGDLLGSVGAIVAAIVILATGWTPIDPILSVLVSCLVLRSARRLLKESFHELLEGTPQEVDIAKLQKTCA